MIDEIIVGVVVGVVVATLNCLVIGTLDRLKDYILKKWSKWFKKD